MGSAKLFFSAGSYGFRVHTPQAQKESLAQGRWGRTETVRLYLLTRVKRNAILRDSPFSCVTICDELRRAARTLCDLWIRSYRALFLRRRECWRESSEAIDSSWSWGEAEWALSTLPNMFGLGDGWQ